AGAVREIAPRARPARLVQNFLRQERSPSEPGMPARGPPARGDHGRGRIEPSAFVAGCLAPCYDPWRESDHAPPRRRRGAPRVGDGAASRMRPPWEPGGFPAGVVWDRITPPE